MQDYMKYFFISSFHLEHTARSKIMTSGIRSQPRPYRRFRGGKDHFQQIHTIISTSRKLESPVIMQRAIDHGMLQLLPIQESSQHHNRTGYNYKCALVNCQLVINKMQTIQLEIENEDIALWALTETWIKEDDNLTPLHICPNKYKLVSIPRSGKQEEDLPWYKESINVTSRKWKPYNMMECADFTVSLPNKTMQLGLLYWPPEGSILQFCQDLVT